MKRLHTAAGWLVFAIAMTVYFFSAERTGSLWDCGEFILGAYKLQVVHPPGAPLFMLVGRLFACGPSDFGRTDDRRPVDRHHRSRPDRGEAP